MGINRKQSRCMAPYETAQSSAPRKGRAVVLGGGLAGLLAARVLADTFEEVMIIERHQRPVVPPQVLPQVVSDLVRTQLDLLFTGLSAELVANGAAISAPPSEPRPTAASTPRAERVGARLQFTEEFIHRHLSQRLESCDGVVMQDCDAVGLVSARERCVGVHVLPRSRSAAARTITAGLIVDAMGAGSRLCLWVEELWGIQVPCDQQMITHYASCLYQLRAGSLPAATIIDLRPTHPYRAAVMAVENGQYVVTVAGPNTPPSGGEEFDQLLRDLLPQQVAAIIAGAQPAGPVIMFASARIRRRFDNVDHLPPNVIALGDSLCSFDPLEGRGFEAAVLEAGILLRAARNHMGA